MKCVVCERIYTDDKTKHKANLGGSLPLGGCGVGALLCAEHMARALEWAGCQWFKESSAVQQKPSNEDVLAALMGE